MRCAGLNAAADLRLWSPGDADPGRRIAVAELFQSWRTCCRRFSRSVVQAQPLDESISTLCWVRRSVLLYSIWSTVVVEVSVYIDGSAGSLIIQMLAAGLLALGATLRVVRESIKRFFQGRFGSRTDNR